MKITQETMGKIDALQNKYNKKCIELIEKDAKKNDKYQIGDIITNNDRIGKILDVLIRVYLESKTYGIYYICKRLTKKLKPYRGGQTITIYFEHVTKSLAKTEQGVNDVGI